MKITKRSAYIRISAKIPKVTKAFLNKLVDRAEEAIADYQFTAPPILIVVTSPKIGFNIVEAIDVWRRAAKKGMQRTCVAYVVLGRPIEPVSKLIEMYASNRGIRLRFFDDKKIALEWLLSHRLSPYR